MDDISLPLSVYISLFPCNSDFQINKSIMKKKKRKALYPVSECMGSTVATVPASSFQLMQSLGGTIAAQAIQKFTSLQDLSVFSVPLDRY